MAAIKGSPKLPEGKTAVPAVEVGQLSQRPTPRMDFAPKPQAPQTPSLSQNMAAGGVPTKQFDPEMAKRMMGQV